MIVVKRTWFESLVSLRGTALVRVWLRVSVTLAVAVTVTLLHQADMLSTKITALPFSLVGVALGVFLGFRNNTSYDRFWEGRKLWGRLVNTTRSLCRQILTLIGPQPGDPSGTDNPGLTDLHRALVYRVIAYVHVFRHHLRDEVELDDTRELLPADELATLPGESNRPVAILQRLGEEFREVWRAGLVDTYHLAILERSLTDLTDIQGGCERIKSTPIPTSYTVLIHRIVALYALALPFGIVDTVQQWTPVVALIIAYAFFGLDAIGEEIEEPFGTDSNDLPLATLSRMIEVNLRQRLGETQLPPLLKPVDGRLS